MGATFSKRERIVSKKLMEQLFTKGGSQSVAAFPVRAVYTLTDRQEGEDGVAVQVLVSVSKRRFRHAVDRNRAKRQIREAYRHHKQVLTDVVPPDKLLIVAFIWLTDRPCPSGAVAHSVAALLRRIAEKQ